MDIEEHCDHSVVVYGLCAICGLNLKRFSNELKSEKYRVTLNCALCYPQ